uniref:Amine oxidase n=1 Tax=Crocodylus porosus TaxID=8502 RepID=A0A7M4ELB5_CROPO
MNLKIVFILLALALATISALICVLLTRGEKPMSCESQTPRSQKEKPRGFSLVFADLTPEEMVQVVKYLQENLGVPLVDASQANPSDNFIYYIDVQLPAKTEVLQFLDGGGSYPPRQALAVLYFGNQADPNITEYVVGPLPIPTTHHDITMEKYGEKLPYYRRPMLAVEYKEIVGFLRETVFPMAPTFMSQTFNYDRTNLAAMTSAPRGFQSTDRNTWFVLFQNVSGFFLHPVGLEVLVDHSSLDLSQWRVSKVFYNGQYYGDMAQLENEFKQGHVTVDKVQQAPLDGGFSSMRPRAAPAAPFPLQYEPRGPRYHIENNEVVYQAWSFAFGMSVNTGMRLFNIRFKGERIAYEISVQEAMSIYGSNCPGGMTIRYMDGSFGIGRFSFPLVQGVDCPYSATYLDVPYLVQSQTPRINKNSLCVFELNSKSPLRRHYSNLHSMYYGGLTNSALVIRSIATVGNYDYIWDFLFYQNGAIEAKVQATGYMSSSFLYGDGLEYGHKVGEHTLGTLHTHSMNYKVDLDVGGIWELWHWEIFPLVHGVDFLPSATYLGTYFLSKTMTPAKLENVLCICELTIETPLRHHYSNLQSRYCGGLSLPWSFSSLPLWPTMTVWDFRFYQNGAIEATVQTTGYMSSSFLYGDGLKYGHGVGEHILGTLPTHSMT